MMKPTTAEKDNVIADLHKVRERIVQSYDGDLKALTRDARKRQISSGHEVVNRISSSDNKKRQSR